MTMHKPVILWVDLTVSARQAELPSVFSESFEIRYCPRPRLLPGIIEAGGLNAVCFDMDFPDRHGLELLRHTKVTFPSMPVLLLTMQHSESLAVWAFRCRVLDYFVKPVASHELERSAKVLNHVCTVRATQRARKPLDVSVPLPPEIPHHASTDDSRLLPAVYFVQQKYSEKFHSAQVAAACGMSTFRFSRSFRETYGLTFQDFVMRYRIREACRLLRDPAVNVTKVAYAVGFNDASYFARVFRRFTGVAPSSFHDQSDAYRHREPELGPLLTALNA